MLPLPESARKAIAAPRSRPTLTPLARAVARRRRRRPRRAAGHLKSSVIVALTSAQSLLPARGRASRVIRSARPGRGLPAFRGGWASAAEHASCGRAEEVCRCVLGGGDRCRSTSEALRTR